jgi:hypothetical protein
MGYDIQKIYDVLVPQGYYMKLFGVTNPPKYGDAFICCPFHGEKSPSFAVSTDKPFYNCFGGSCGKKGDWINFLIDFNNWDFNQAIEFLASEAGISKEPYSGYKPATIKQYEKIEKRVEITENDIAVNWSYLFKCVDNLEAFPALYDKFEQVRGINKQTQINMMIGIDIEKKEWIIPVFSIEHLSGVSKSPSLVGFERRKSDFTMFDFTDGRKSTKCLKSKGTPSVLSRINEYSDTMEEVIILEGFLDAYCYYNYLIDNNIEHTTWILSPSCGLSKIQSQVENLNISKFKKVKIMLDNDKEGLKAMGELNAKFPDYQYIVLPEGIKDFSDYYRSVKNECIKFI